MANPFPFSVGAVLTAAQMNGIGEFTNYTPVLTATTTNPTLGTGSSQNGSYARIQNLIIARFFIRFGTAGVNAGSGNYKVSLPVTAAETNSFFENTVGQTAFYDNSAFASFYANVWINDTSNITLTFQNAFNGALANLTAAAPVIPAASDAFSGLIIYRAA
jgi:hypothetical protein